MKVNGNIPWAAVAVIITIIVNGFALVWGAATLKSSVDNLTRTLQELKQTVTAIDTRQRQITDRVSSLEGIHSPRGDGRR